MSFAPKVKRKPKTPPKPTTSPTIIDLARLAAEQPGVDYLTPYWEATLRAFYALELRDVDIEILTTHITQRSRSYWEARRAGALPGAAKRNLARRASGAGEPLELEPFRELWAQVGRRGRKSSTMALLGLYESQYGEHEQYAAPDEPLQIPVISHAIAGTHAVTKFVELYAGALGIELRATVEKNRQLLKILDSPFELALTPANKTATRGPASPVLILDEFAHLDGDDHVNTDKEILAAAKPATLQFKTTSKVIVISSPLGEVGVFHETVAPALADESNTRVLAVTGPSWEFGSFDEQGAAELYTECRALEKDDETFNREYGGVPSGVEGVAFPKQDVARSFVVKPGIWSWGRPIMVLDSSGGGVGSNNTFACAVVRCGSPTRERRPIKDRTPDGTIIVRRDASGAYEYEPQATRQLVLVSQIFGFTGKQIRELGMAEVVRQVAEVAKANSCDFVFGDQYGAAFLSPLLRTHEVEMRYFAHSNASKHEAVLTLKWLMRDEMLQIAEHERMRSDLQSYPRKISGGRINYGATLKSGHHFDHASSMITLGHVLNGLSIGGGVRGSDQGGREYWVDRAPTRSGVGRTEWVGESNMIGRDQSA